MVTALLSSQLSTAQRLNSPLSVPNFRFQLFRFSAFPLFPLSTSQLLNCPLCISDRPVLMTALMGEKGRAAAGVIKTGRRLSGL